MKSQYVIVKHMTLSSGSGESFILKSSITGSKVEAEVECSHLNATQGYRSDSGLGTKIIFEVEEHSDEYEMNGWWI